MWWQLFCKKQALKWGQTCPWNVLCFNMYDGESPKSVWIQMPYTVQTWLHSFFGNLSWHWREGDVVTSAQFKSFLLLYAVQTVENMVDIFIRDRALKECPLCRSQYGCCSATSIETSVSLVIYMHLECSWTWWLYKECSLVMWKHLKPYVSCQNTWSWTHLMWMSQPHARNQNQGTLPHGRQRSSMFEGSSGESFTTHGWSSWQGLICNGWTTA